MIRRTGKSRSLSRFFAVPRSVFFPTFHMPRLDDRRLGVGHFPGQGLLFVLFHGVLTSPVVCAASPKRYKAPCGTVPQGASGSEHAQRNNPLKLFQSCRHPLPLPLGEVAERSEDGEGTGVKPSQSPAVTAPPKGEPRSSALV